MSDLLIDSLERGFDRSRIDEDGVVLRCSQCEALVINGHPAHESGCPNIVHECKGCNATVAHAGSYCNSCRGLDEFFDELGQEDNSDVCDWTERHDE